MRIMDKWVLKKETDLTYYSHQHRTPSMPTNTNSEASAVYQSYLQKDSSIINDDTHVYGTNISQVKDSDVTIADNEKDLMNPVSSNKPTSTTALVTMSYQILKQSIQRLKACESSLHAVEFFDRDFVVEYAKYLRYKLANVIRQLESSEPFGYDGRDNHK
jgi:hypothetical protein